MNNIIKTAMVTGFVSAGVLVGGTASHAADLGTQSTFNSQGQLSLSGDQSTSLDLNMDLSNQIHLTLDSNKVTVTSNNNQATTTAKSNVIDNAKLEKGQLGLKADQSTSNGAPSGTINANMTSNKKVSGSGGASLKWNNEFASAGGYYISLDHQSSRLALDAPNSGQSVVLEEKSTTSPSSVLIDLNGTSELHSSFKNAGLKTTMKQTGGASITSNNTNDAQVSADTGATSTSQFDLLGTLTKAFNLQSK